MSQIQLETTINSDIQSCFDIARNIDIHQESLQFSGEIAIAGTTSGLISLGETVTWEAEHFGFVQHLTSKITEFRSPDYFVDEMVSGAFKFYRHEHIFLEKENKTIMIDKFYFESPFGLVGKLVDFLFLNRYMKRLLKIRSEYLKQKAETVSNSKGVALLIAN